MNGGRGYTTDYEEILQYLTGSRFVIVDAGRYQRIGVITPYYGLIWLVFVVKSAQNARLVVCSTSFQQRLEVERKVERERVHT